MTLMRGISTWTNHREQICEKKRAARWREGKGERERGRPKKRNAKCNCRILQRLF